MRTNSSPLRRCALPGGVAALLVLTALLPLVRPPLLQVLRAIGTGRTAAGAGALALVALVLTVGRRRRSRPNRAAGVRPAAVHTADVRTAGVRSVGISTTEVRTTLGRGWRLLLHLWPVVLLTAVYPLASHRMTGHEVGGVGLTTFLLAVALTVPWLTQGVCMPLYRVLGPLMADADPRTLRRQFCAAWPTTFAQSVPALLACALPLALGLHWSATAVGGYVLLVGLDVLFAQTLVLANLGRSRVGWALAWTGYAVPLLVAPAAWYLPPLCGLLVQVVALRGQLWARPVWIPWRDVAGDLLRGLLLGSVMWADKVFYFLHSGGRFPVATVFLALLPAICAYNYYFICAAPAFDASVARLRDAMRSDSLGALGECSRAVSRAVATAVRRTALLGAVCTSVTGWVLATAEPELTALVASVAVASWLFTMITVLSYKLDYIGERLPGQVFGAVHLGICAAAFGLLPAGPTAYFAVLVAEVAVFVAVLAAYHRAWRTPEYTFFWQHALAW